MKFSEIELKNFGVELIRDGLFETLGSFTRKNHNMLVFIDEEKYIPNLFEEENKYTSVICKPEFLHLVPSHMGVGVSDSPDISFYTLHNYLARTFPSYHILPETDISHNATIHPTAFVDTHVKISDGCIIHPNATILEGTILEDNVIVGPGSVIGGEGFRFLRMKTGILPIVHVGGVILKKCVEVQSNACIDKAVYHDSTIIGEDTKIDNLVHIGHNVTIGQRCLIAASAMIGGSTVIGNDVWIGPNASISDNLVIEDSASVTMGAVVTKNVPNSMTVSGNFAIEHSKFIKFIKTIR